MRFRNLIVIRETPSTFIFTTKIGILTSIIEMIAVIVIQLYISITFMIFWHPNLRSTIFLLFSLKLPDSLFSFDVIHPCEQYLGMRISTLHNLNDRGTPSGSMFVIIFHEYPSIVKLNNLRTITRGSKYDLFTAHSLQLEM